MKNDNKSLNLEIDGKHYQWNEQYITGLKVKELGSIAAEAEIYLAIKDPRKDELIKDEDKVDLARPGVEHFFSKVPISLIIVNGREKSWKEDEISYEEVVKLAYPDYVDNGTVMYTVTYKRGPRQNPEGTMVKGDKVYVKHKMIFNVTPTSRS